MLVLTPDTTRSTHRVSTTQGPRRRRRYLMSLRRRRDEGGLSLLELVIAIMLLGFLILGAVVAIQFFRGEGQTQLAKTNLTTAVLAAETAHNFSSDATFKIGSIEAAAPELTFVTLATTAATGRYTQPDTPGEVGYRINAADIDDGTAGSANYYNIPKDDAIWLMTKSDNGDSYCALVVAEVKGNPDLAGTWYGSTSEDATANDALCGLVNAAIADPTGFGTTGTPTANSWTGSRAVPDLDS